jgi:nicotinic acid phosphoribosyltransferase
MPKAPVKKTQPIAEKSKQLHKSSKRRKNQKGGLCYIKASDLPVLALTDSYKLSHQLMYPNAKKLVAYGECRGPLKIEGEGIYIGDKNNGNQEKRLVNFGLKYIIENYIDKQITKETIVDIIKFYKTHGFLNSQYPIDEEKLKSLIGKYPPIKIYGLKEGTVMLPRTPVFIIEAEGEYAPFVTYFETILTMVWYPISVATLSKCCKDIFQRKYEEIKVPQAQHFFIDFSLHDFGFRGSSSIETSTIGGMAHLLNFKGTDTLSAAYYAQMNYNNGNPVGESIAASEHSVMTSHKTEYHAFLKILKNFAGGRNQERDDNKIPKAPFAIVMDSYDYEKSLMKIFPEALKTYINERRINFNERQKNFNFNTNKGRISQLSPLPRKNDYNTQGGTIYENHFNHFIEINTNPDKSKFEPYVEETYDNYLKILETLDIAVFGSKPLFNKEEISLLPCGFQFTFRPDSGNPYVAVIQSLIAGVRLFGIDEAGSYKNKDILFIKPKFVRTIQGDGINIFTIKDMLDVITDPICVMSKSAIQSNGQRWAFSPYSLLCGMGGGLLQKVNRDTVNFATKLCYVQYDDLTERNIMKSPITDADKRSLPGLFKVKKNEQYIPMVHPIENQAENSNTPYGEEMILYYDYKKNGLQINNIMTKTFNELKEDVRNNWDNMNNWKGTILDIRKNGTPELKTIISNQIDKFLDARSNEIIIKQQETDNIIRTDNDNSPQIIHDQKIGKYNTDILKQSQFIKLAKDDKFNYQNFQALQGSSGGNRHDKNVNMNKSKKSSSKSCGS